MLPRRITVSTAALLRMCRLQELADPHTVLRGPAVWMDDDTDREANHAMWDEFAKYGLVDRRGRLDSDALDALSTLTQPKSEYLGCFTVRGQWRCVLVASGYETVVAVREGDSIELRSVRGESQIHTLIRQLPDVPPASISSFNIRLDDADQTDHGRRDAQKLANLVREPLRSLGELYVGVRDHHGYRSIADNPIHYADYQSGRALIMLSGGHLSVTPATATMLIERLTTARQQLAVPSW